MKKIILILLLFCMATSKNYAQEISNNLTQLTTDKMNVESKQSYNWTDSSIQTISENYRPKRKCKWKNGRRYCDDKTAVGQLLVNIWDFLFGWLDSGSSDDDGGDDSSGLGGGNPLAGPVLSPSQPNSSNTNSNTHSGAGGSNAPPQIPIPPPINPSPTDDIKGGDCNGTFTTTKQFIMASDTCPTGKSIHTYQITTDCFGNTFTNLVSQECFECSGYPVGYGYSNSAILNWVENSYIANNNTSFITFQSIDDITKWNNTANFRPSTTQVALVDSLRQNGASEISIFDINKIQQNTDSITQYVNFDDYSVQVDSLPTIANKKQTATQLLEYIRINFEKFQDTTFQKILPYNQSQKAIWANTTKFKGAKNGVVLKIQRLNGNNGVAIATNINNADTLSKKFIITNVTDPNLNGKRNFYTNREFGYKKNTNNTYTFYCRTVDRTSKQSNLLKKILGDTLIETDKTVGENFSRTVASFINQNNGVAVENDFEIVQADEQNIKDVLVGLADLCNLAGIDPKKCPAGQYRDTCGKCVGGSTNLRACELGPCPTDANLTITYSQLASIFKNKSVSDNYSLNKRRTDSILKYLNLYMHDYNINSRLRLAHFLTQCIVETGGFNVITEDWEYKTKARMFDMFKDRKKLNDLNYSYYLRCKCLFDMYYAGNGKDHNNGDSTTHDGFKFRGRGAIQLTHRDSYWRFTKFYQQKYNDYNTDFESNPDLIVTNMKYFVLSALWEFSVDKSKNGNVYNALKDADNDNVRKVSFGVNGGLNDFDKRQLILPFIKSLLCL